MESGSDYDKGPPTVKVLYNKDNTNMKKVMYHLSYLDIKHQSNPPTPSVSRFSGTLAGKGLYKSFDEHFVHQN